MAEPVRNYFKFHSDALADDTLLVARIDGHEEISKLYRFELELGSAKLDINLDAVVKEPAWIGIKQPLQSSGASGDLTRLLQVHGMITSFELVERREVGIWYRAVLVPRLWKLSQEYQSRIFLDQSIPQILEEVLKRAGFSPDDYELRLSGRYASREFVVQYEESDLDFLQRWMEHEGIYYFFENTMEAEKVVFADGPSAASPDELQLSYRPPAAGSAGAEERPWEERVMALACSIRAVPKEVVLKDYNWRRPTDDLRCSAEVSPNGVGIHFEYNNHYKTKDEGNALAKIRAQERKCRIRSFSGESNCRAFRAGKEYELVNHYRSDFNEKYLLTRVHHSGTQELLAGSSFASAAKYRNDFGALPASETFRPERRTGWPAIKGVMNATVDGSGSGQYAEVDTEGRYKVILPFDLSGRVEGKASRFVRMQQPYSGNGHGMHFPLHKGAEVLLTFVDGDPDRPIISGTVPNTDNPSVVNANNHTASGIRTAGGNAIEMEDADGHQRIHMASGSGRSQLVLGSGSDDRADLTSWTTTISAVLMSGQYAGYSSTMYAGSKVTLEAGKWWAALITALIEQTYPQTLAANAISGSGLKLPKAVQADTFVSLMAAILKYGWKKRFLDWDTSRFEDLGAYLLRWNGTSRLELHSGKGEDILIGSDKGEVRLQSCKDVKLRAGGEFMADSNGDARLRNLSGQVFLEEDGAGIIHWTGGQNLRGPTVIGTADAIKDTVAQMLQKIGFWKSRKVAKPGPDLVKFGLEWLDYSKPTCALLLDDDGILLRMEKGKAPREAVGMLRVRDEGIFSTKKSLMLAGGGGEKPKEGPFINLDKSITIDCSKDKNADVIIKAAKNREITVDSMSITLDMGDGKTSLTVWDDGDIDITGKKKITIEGQSISLNSKSKKIDCGGATLTNCLGIDK